MAESIICANSPFHLAVACLCAQQTRLQVAYSRVKSRVAERSSPSRVSSRRSRYQVMSQVKSIIVKSSQSRYSICVGSSNLELQSFSSLYMHRSLPFVNKTRKIYISSSCI